MQQKIIKINKSVEKYICLFKNLKTKGEDVMQQRYCNCGCAIWVEYHHPNHNPQIFFRLKENVLDEVLKNCPLCQRMLSIDERKYA